MVKPSARDTRRSRDAALIRTGRRLTFTGQYEQDGGLWFVRVPELYAATQAPTFADVEAMVRDLVAVTLDVPSDAFDVRLVPRPEERGSDTGDGRPRPSRPNDRPRS